VSLNFEGEFKYFLQFSW